MTKQIEIKKKKINPSIWDLETEGQGHFWLIVA